MIQVIAGHKGSGKTKRLIDIANDAFKSEHGTVAFIDDDKRYMYDLRHEIRLVCIDAFLKLVKKTNLNDMEDFFARLNALSESSRCNFVINISCGEENLPAFVKQYQI